MKRFLSVLLLLAVFTVPAFAQLRSDPVNPIPPVPWRAVAPGQVRDWQLYEAAEIRSRMFNNFVYAGGLHGTSASLVSSAFATEAFVPQRVNQTAAAITYPAIAADICWTIISSVQTTITGWTRSGTTAYYVKCQGNTVSAQPPLPDNSAWLMQVNVTASAISSVVNIRVMNPSNYSGIYNITDLLYGAIPGSQNDAAPAINAAITDAATANGVVFIPRGTFCLKTSVIIKSNVKIQGTGKGSLLKVCEVAAFSMLTNDNIDLENFVIDSVAFDGALNYPADSTVYHIGLTTQNRGINIDRTLASPDPARTTNDVKNVAIKGCFFNQINAGAIFIRGLNMKDIDISGNYAYKGSYTNKVIMVKAPVGAVASNRANNVIVDNNRSDINGPQYFYDPSIEAWTSSTDGIEFDLVRDSVISNNVVNYASSIGIRVENSVSISVVGNTVKESGLDGISVYKSSFAVSVVGNSITNWGRTPFAAALRSYGAGYVIAREFPIAASAPLPVDPTASSWFVAWPYSINNINMATVVPYSDIDYYTAGPDGILPFRGSSGISVTSNSSRCAIVGNVITGSAAVDGAGKKLYANEYGITPTHVVNNQVGTGTTMDNCTVIGNTINTVSIYSIYHPHFHDPINEVGVNGLATYIGNTSVGNVEYVEETATNLRLSESGIGALYADKTALPTYFIAANAGTANAATVAGFAMSMDADRSVRSYLRQVRNGGETPLQVATLLENPIEFITNNVIRLKITGTGGFRSLTTTNGPVGTFTYAAAAATVVPNTNVTGSSIVQIMPTNATGGALLRDHGVHVSSQIASTSFTLGTSDGVAAAGTETYNYIVFN